MQQGKNLAQSSARLPASARPWRQSLSVLIMVSALSLISCRSHRTLETVQESSTIQTGLAHTEYETLECITRFASGDSVSLAIPMKEIQSLPEGAAFTKKQGRTRVSLKFKDGAVVAEAESDSVCQTESHYERRARDSLRQRQDAVLHEQRAKENVTAGNLWNWWFWLSLAPLLILLVIIVSEIRKVFKQH